MTPFQEAWDTVESFIKVLGPFAGMYFAARVVISYQKDLLGSLQTANGSLREEIHEQDERINALERRLDEVRRDQRKERDWCDARLGELASVLRANGIQVPPTTQERPF